VTDIIKEFNMISLLVILLGVYAAYTDGFLHALRGSLLSDDSVVVMAIAIVLLLILRYYHYSYLKYKYSYEDQLAQELEEEAVPVNS